MVKTKKQLLEGLYDEVHYQKIQSELVVDALNTKIIQMIDPKMKDVSNELEKQKAQIMVKIQAQERSMDRIMEKIKKEK